MIIDEIYQTINDKTKNNQIETNESEETNIIKQGTKNPSFATAIKTVNNHYMIK